MRRAEGLDGGRFSDGTQAQPRSGKARIARTVTRDVLRAYGLEVRRMRHDAGISQRRLARASGISQAHLSGIESGEVGTSVEALACVAQALGGELRFRVHPGSGPAIRDHIQARMAEGLLRRLHLPRWRRFLEVRVHRPVRGVIDLVLDDPKADVVVAAEIHSQLRRLEEQVRWASSKAGALSSSELGAAWAGLGRDPAIRRLLVLRSTRATRELAVVFEESLRTVYPARAADLFAALTTGESAWPGDGIVWMTVGGQVAKLMDRPPNGVRLGR